MKKRYESPEVTVVSFRVEEGFQNSSMRFSLYHEETEDNQMEDYTYKEGWSNEGTNTFWN